VLPLKGVWGDTGDGYQERFPGTDEFGVPCWHWELYKNLRDSSTSKKVLCSWEMQLHQIKVGNEFYAGTEREGTWSIFHDALSSWDQKFLRALGFEHRQLITYTANLGTRYALSLPGNTPGACRGLDSYGFARLAHALRVAADISKSFYNDARAAHLQDKIFHTGTPMQLRASLERCWSTLDSAHFVTDILGFDRFWHLVMDADGGPLREVEKRSGKRYIGVQKNRNRPLLHKPRARQRKATMKSLATHPDLEPFLALLKVDAENLMQELETFGTAAATAMDENIGMVLINGQDI
jgi:hypothetical protein